MQKNPTHYWSYILVSEPRGTPQNQLQPESHSISSKLIFLYWYKRQQMMHNRQQKDVELIGIISKHDMIRYPCESEIIHYEILFIKYDI